MKFFISAGFGLLSVIAPAVTITFDEFGNQPSTFDTASPVNDKYVSQGVRFRGPNASTADGGVLLNASTFTVPAHSGNNFLAFTRLGNEGSGAPIGPEQITFTNAVNQVSIYAANVDTSHAATFTLTAYNSAGAQIGSSSASPAIITWGLISLNATGISKIMLDETSGAHTFVFDDLSFSTVPEPSSVIALAFGLGTVGLVARRRRS